MIKYILLICEIQDDLQTKGFNYYECNKHILALVQQNKFFQGLNDSQLTRVLALSKQVTFHKDEHIIKEGDTPNAFYLILEGEVEITKKDPDKNIFYKITTLKKDTIFGEAGLITNQKRNASIVASSEVIALEFLNNAFQSSENLDIYLTLNRNMTEELVVRLDNSYKLVANSMRTELQKSRKLKFFQFITIIIMTIFLIQLGLALNYLISNTGLCADINKTRQEMNPMTHYVPN